jgi:hypothetical protein
MRFAGWNDDDEMNLGGLTDRKGWRKTVFGSNRNCSVVSMSPWVKQGLNISEVLEKEEVFKEDEVPKEEDEFPIAEELHKKSNFLPKQKFSSQTSEASKLTQSLLQTTMKTFSNNFPLQLTNYRQIIISFSFRTVIFT